ncbi:uncharacterized protein BKCO1_1700054 [Diplodia corticola]|uniref:LYR motif-containing protein Cup1-like N-terminal domain-containing protein n=1 Tax=Diplodia corticola TaxID=236234 RepID=A0A1J9S773_9PEZI|nr:uncharacterized protein BKCO1_1700054 [Diplodia corticola]OJD35453.1 hypothetical protein BKCO1_1700054 [Diplodia corticola]
MLPAADASGARHLLRALLRECTYLPDPAARLYAHHQVVSRFLDYHPLQLEGGYYKDPSDNPALSPRRLRGALQNARKSLNFLRRANEGEMAPLQQLLLLTYGRTGKRRHELMRTLLTPDTISESEAVELWQAEVEATLDPSKAITGIPRAVEEAPRREGRPHKYKISPRYSQLRALLESQMSDARPIEMRRAKLKSAHLEVPLTNIWMRPFPRKREVNMVHKWYATVLDKVLPPLPEDEWERLRDLVSGARKWSGLKRRRPGVPTHMSTYDVAKLANVGGTAGERFLSLACREHMLPEHGSKADMLLRLSTTASTRFQAADRWLTQGSANPDVLASLLQDELEMKRLPRQSPGRRRAQNITPRLMRHIWAKVFSQCPVLRWNEQNKGWIVEWGTWEHLQREPEAVCHNKSLFEGVDERGRTPQAVGISEARSPQAEPHSEIR